MLDPHGFKLVTVAMGVAAAVQVFTESGAATYLAVRRPEGLGGSFRILLRWQAGVSTVAALVVMGLTVRTHPELSRPEWLGLLSFVATFSIEAVARFMRVVLLRLDRSLEYGMVEGGLAAARMVSVLALVIGGGLESFMLGAAVAVAFAAWLLGHVYRALPSGENSVQPATWREIPHALSFGAPIMAAGLYAQTPVLVAASMSSLTTAAVLALATRLVQPLEIFAATYAQMQLPRLVGGTSRRRFLSVLGLGGVGAALAGAVGSWAFIRLTSAPGQAFEVSALLLLVLPVKFLNYGLAALINSVHAPLARLAVSLTLGVVSTSLIIALARESPLVMVTVVVVNELILGASLGAVYARKTRGELR